MTATATDDNVGLFLVRYRIGTGLPGAPTLDLALTVDTVDRVINGSGRLTQATNPPLNQRLRAHGSYGVIPMPPEPKIAANLVGYPTVDWPPHGGIGPVIPPNLYLHMVLDEGFRTGVASYRYRTPDPSGAWIEVNGVPVRQV
jgi:hypothetical protein